MPSTVDRCLELETRILAHSHFKADLVGTGNTLASIYLLSPSELCTCTASIDCNRIFSAPLALPCILPSTLPTAIRMTRILPLILSIQNFMRMTLRNGRVMSAVMWAPHFLPRLPWTMPPLCWRSFIFRGHVHVSFRQGDEFSPRLQRVLCKQLQA